MNTEETYPHLIGKTYAEVVSQLSVEEDQGDCCGWSDWEKTEQFPQGDIREYTLKHCTVTDYDDDDQVRSRKVVNFVFTDGDNLAILGYDMSAGSGSGWSYGAYVTLKYSGKELCEVSW